MKLSSEPAARRPRRRAGTVFALAMSWATVLTRSNWARAAEDNFRAEGGGFIARYTDLYGTWFGGTARIWVLDSSGKRRWSGYLNIVDLHWIPEKPAHADDAVLHSTFFLGRVMKQW